MKKAIVIGLDGLEPKIVESMLATGELPNLAKIKTQGGYARLQTTYPAQTPVAWSTFSTGTNPGGHGIFDFLSRDPNTYLPQLALSKYEQKNAFVPPKVVNLRRGMPFWEMLSNSGIHSTIIRCPCTYPPDKINGRLIAGVGVPDLRGGLGTSTYYTFDPNTQKNHSEKIVLLESMDHRQIETHLIGPRNPKTRSDIKFDIQLILNPEDGKVILRSNGQPSELEIKEGRWSSWLKVKFKIGMLQSVSGILRFYLKSIEPDFELYASPINFDPEAPLFPITYPEDYSSELQTRIGNYYTIGMAEDHDGLINGRIDEAAYLHQCAVVMRERERMMLLELERLDQGFFFCLFDTPDRLQHMFWRFRERDHPANRSGLAAEFIHAIENHYRELDSLIGKALQFADDQTLFIVLSDHGMNSFQRGLNLNTWLYDNGFLCLKNGLQPGGDAGDLLRGIDWGKTKAYALGLGAIYLNLKGREVNGIVDSVQAEEIKTNLKKGLTNLRDPELGKIAVHSVMSREEIYKGPYLDEAPDLLINFKEGYRVSWGTPLGGVPVGLFEDNIKKWAGDHVIHPSLVPGILFINREFHNRSDLSLVDLAPTILTALGCSKGPNMEGESLL